MKIIPFFRVMAWAVVLPLCFGSVLAAEEHSKAPLTALELAKEGNRYIGEQAKDKLMQIRSEKSVGSLSPNVWFVVYNDPTATFKAVEVKFGGGKMLDVKRPLRVIETIAKSKPMDREKLKIDSDKAIEIAIAEPIFKDLTLKSVSARLENSDSGPLWKIRVWAAKLKKKTEQADLGEIHLSAEDGKVVKTDVDINKVD